jgi:Domain of unknown function (DUF4262)
MCWMCDHPGSSRADYLGYMRELMACCGWAVQGVEREGVHPPWAYTVGLTLAGRPELVVTGMPMLRAARLLSEQAEHMLHAGLPTLGEPVELIGGPVIQVVKVAEPAAHLNIAVEMFGSRIQAMQVVHADDRGHWPWETGYRGVRGGQPVLGPVTLPTGSPAPAGDQAASPTGPSQPGQPRHRRAKDRRTTATRQTSRGSGRRQASRGPRRRSARSSARPPSPPR